MGAAGAKICVQMRKQDEGLCGDWSVPAARPPFRIFKGLEPRFAGFSIRHCMPAWSFWTPKIKNATSTCVIQTYAWWGGEGGGGDGSGDGGGGEREGGGSESGGEGGGGNAGGGGAPAMRVAIVVAVRTAARGRRRLGQRLGRWRRWWRGRRWRWRCLPCCMP